MGLALSENGYRLSQSVSKNAKCLLVAFMVTALSACGGGGGDSSSDDVPDNDIPGNEPGIAEGPDNVNSEELVNDDSVSDDMELVNNEEAANDSEIVDVDDPTQCNVATQRQWAYNAMQDYYVFADQVPVVDPQVYESAADVVRQLRFEERDPYSGVSNATTSSLQLDAGLTFDVGYRWRFDDDGNARVIQVHAASPFGLAGIERGDILLTVDGLQWTSQTLIDTFDERVIGTPDNPATSSWQIRKRDTGEIVDIEITSAQYAIDTVMRANVYTNPAFDGKTGYLLFGSFLNTSEQELTNVARYFNDQQITELVLDLRYNGGGRVFIASQLASMIGGSELSGQPLYEYRYNDRYMDNDNTLNFAELVDQPGLSRVIVLTTRATASASEIVIAGLQPYIDVVTIGGPTSGKPYISFPNDRCDERLNVMEAEGFNINGDTVFGGIEPTCLAADDITRDFDFNSVTNEVEGLLLAGLDYVVFGTCNTQQPATTDSLSARSVARMDASGRQGMKQVEGTFVE